MINFRDFSPEDTGDYFNTNPLSGKNVNANKEDIVSIEEEKSEAVFKKFNLKNEINEQRIQLAKNKLLAAKKILSSELIKDRFSSCGTINNVIKEFNKHSPHVVNKPLNGETKKEYQEARELARSCEEIVNLLENMIDGKESMTMDKLSDKIIKAWNKHQEKVAMATNPTARYVTYSKLFLQFLEALSYQIYAQTEGMSVLETIGKTALEKSGATINGDPKEKVSTSVVSESLRTVFKNVKGDTKKGIKALLWGLKNLLKAILSFIDNTRFGDRFYRSTTCGNPNMWIGDFSVNEKTAHFTLGASPMSNPFFKPMLNHLQRHDMKMVHHTLENSNEKGENRRLKQMREVQENNNNFQVIETPGKLKEIKEIKVKKLTDFSDFHSKLKEIEKYTGFTKGIISENEKNVFNDLLNAFLSNKGIEWKNLSTTEKHRYFDAMLLGFNGLIAVKKLLELDKNTVLGQACKQDVDRGPVVNAVTIAFTQLRSQGHLTKNDAEQLVGLLLTRSHLVDNRIMNQDRHEAFELLFDIIGSNEGAFVEMLKAIKPGTPLTFTSAQSD